MTNEGDYFECDREWSTFTVELSTSKIFLSDLIEDLHVENQNSLCVNSDMHSLWKESEGQISFTSTFLMRTPNDISISYLTPSRNTRFSQ